MPEFPIPSARILLVSQIQGGQLPSLPPCPVRLWLCVVCEGCTVASTMVDHQQREVRGWPNVNGSERCRPKHHHQQQQQQSSPAAAAARMRSDMDQSVFRIYKGIKCFDFCKSQNVIATGGIRYVTLRYVALYFVYTMKLARRAGSTSARRALDELARRALVEPACRASSSSQLHRVNGVLRTTSHCLLRYAATFNAQFTTSHQRRRVADAT